MKQDVINILDSVDKLPLEDRILFQKELKKRAKKDMRILLNEMDKENSHFTEEDVMNDIDKVVKELRTDRAKKNKSSTRH